MVGICFFPHLYSLKMKSLKNMDWNGMSAICPGQMQVRTLLYCCKAIQRWKLSFNITAGNFLEVYVILVLFGNRAGHFVYDYSNNTDLPRVAGFKLIYWAFLHLNQLVLLALRQWDINVLVMIILSRVYFNIE